MNHSMYRADRQTHRRIIGSAFVVICIVIMLATASAVFGAGMPVAMTDGGYFIVR